MGQEAAHASPHVCVQLIQQGSHTTALGKDLPEIVGKALLVLWEPGQSIC